MVIRHSPLLLVLGGLALGEQTGRELAAASIEEDVFAV